MPISVYRCNVNCWTPQHASAWQQLWGEEIHGFPQCSYQSYLASDIHKHISQHLGLAWKTGGFRAMFNLHRGAEISSFINELFIVGNVFGPSHDLKVKTLPTYTLPPTLNPKLTFEPSFSKCC